MIYEDLDHSNITLIDNELFECLSVSPLSEENKVKAKGTPSHINRNETILQEIYKNQSFKSAKVQRKSLLKRNEAQNNICSTPYDSARHKEVSFGKKLTPEFFDKQLPPDTPLKKGTRPENLAVKKHFQRSLKCQNNISTDADILVEGTSLSMADKYIFNLSPNMDMDPQLIMDPIQYKQNPLVDYSYSTNETKMSYIENKEAKVFQSLIPRPKYDANLEKNEIAKSKVVTDKKEVSLVTKATKALKPPILRKNKVLKNITKVSAKGDKLGQFTYKSHRNLVIKKKSPQGISAAVGGKYNLMLKKKNSKTASVLKGSLNTNKDRPSKIETKPKSLINVSLITPPSVGNVRQSSGQIQPELSLSYVNRSGPNNSARPTSKKSDSEPGYVRKSGSHKSGKHATGTKAKPAQYLLKFKISRPEGNRPKHLYANAEKKLLSSTRKKAKDILTKTLQKKPKTPVLASVTILEGVKNTRKAFDKVSTVVVEAESATTIHLGRSVQHLQKTSHCDKDVRVSLAKEGFGTPNMSTKYPGVQLTRIDYHVTKKQQSSTRKAAKAIMKRTIIQKGTKVKKGLLPQPKIKPKKISADNRTDTLFDKVSIGSYTKDLMVGDVKHDDHSNHQTGVVGEDLEREASTSISTEIVPNVIHGKRRTLPGTSHRSSRGQPERMSQLIPGKHLERGDLVKSTSSADRSSRVRKGVSLVPLETPLHRRIRSPIKLISPALTSSDPRSPTPKGEAVMGQMVPARAKEPKVPRLGPAIRKGLLLANKKSKTPSSTRKRANKIVRVNRLKMIKRKSPIERAPTVRRFKMAARGKKLAAKAASSVSRTTAPTKHDTDSTKYIGCHNPLADNDKLDTSISRDVVTYPRSPAMVSSSGRKISQSLSQTVRAGPHSKYSSPGNKERVNRGSDKTLSVVLQSQTAGLEVGDATLSDNSGHTGSDSFSYMAGGDSLAHGRLADINVFTSYGMEASVTTTPDKLVFQKVSSKGWNTNSYATQYTPSPKSMSSSAPKQKFVSPTGPLLSASIDIRNDSFKVDDARDETLDGILDDHEVRDPTPVTDHRNNSLALFERSDQLFSTPTYARNSPKMISFLKRDSRGSQRQHPKRELISESPNIATPRPVLNGPINRTPERNDSSTPRSAPSNAASRGRRLQRHTHFISEEDVETEILKGSRSGNYHGIVPEINVTECDEPQGRESTVSKDKNTPQRLDSSRSKSRSVSNLIVTSQKLSFGSSPLPQKTEKDTIGNSSTASKRGSTIGSMYSPESLIPSTGDNFSPSKFTVKEVKEAASPVAKVCLLIETLSLPRKGRPSAKMAEGSIVGVERERRKGRGSTRNNETLGGNALDMTNSLNLIFPPTPEGLRGHEIISEGNVSLFYEQINGESPVMEGKSKIAEVEGENSEGEGVKEKIRLSKKMKQTIHSENILKEVEKETNVGGVRRKVRRDIESELMIASEKLVSEAEMENNVGGTERTGLVKKSKQPITKKSIVSVVEEEINVIGGKKRKARRAEKFKPTIANKRIIAEVEDENKCSGGKEGTLLPEESKQTILDKVIVKVEDETNVDSVKMRNQPAEKLKQTTVNNDIKGEVEEEGKDVGGGKRKDQRSEKPKQTIADKKNTKGFNNEITDVKNPGRRTRKRGDKELVVLVRNSPTVEGRLIQILNEEQMVTKEESHITSKKKVISKKLIESVSHVQENFEEVHLVGTAKRKTRGNKTKIDSLPLVIKSIPPPPINSITISTSKAGAPKKVTSKKLIPSVAQIQENLEDMDANTKVERKTRGKKRKSELEPILESIPPPITTFASKAEDPASKFAGAKPKRNKETMKVRFTDEQSNTKSSVRVRQLRMKGHLTDDVQNLEVVSMGEVEPKPEVPTSSRSRKGTGVTESTDVAVPIKGRRSKATIITESSALIFEAAKNTRQGRPPKVALPVVRSEDHQISVEKGDIKSEEVGGKRLMVQVDNLPTEEGQSVKVRRKGKKEAILVAASPKLGRKTRSKKEVNSEVIEDGGVLGGKKRKINFVMPKVVDSDLRKRETVLVVEDMKRMPIVKVVKPNKSSTRGKKLVGNGSIDTLSPKVRARKSKVAASPKASPPKSRCTRSSKNEPVSTQITIGKKGRSSKKK